MFKIMLKKILVPAAIFLFAVSPILMPALVSAQSINIPCDGPSLQMQGATTTDVGCGFSDLVKLASNLMNFLILLSIPLAAILFAYAGFLMVTAVGNSSQISKAKGIFWYVLWGLVIMLSAWLIVKLITSALLDKSQFNDLLGTNEVPAAQEFTPGPRAIV